MDRWCVGVGVVVCGWVRFGWDGIEIIGRRVATSSMCAFDKTSRGEATYIPGAALRDEDGHHGAELDRGDVGLDLAQELVEALPRRLPFMYMCAPGNRELVAVAVDVHTPRHPAAQNTCARHTQTQSHLAQFLVLVREHEEEPVQKLGEPVQHVDLRHLFLVGFCRLFGVCVSPTHARGWAGWDKRAGGVDGSERHHPHTYAPRRAR